MATWCLQWIAPGSTGLKHAVVRGEDVPCLLVQRVARLRAHGDLGQEYLRYVIGGPDFTRYVRAVQTGTAVPHISASQISAFEFRLPPASEQTRIAASLGALDDKIDSNWRLATVLDATVATMFRRRFVDGIADAAQPGGGRVGTLNDLADATEESVNPSETPAAVFEHFSIPAFDASNGPEEVAGATILSGKTRIPNEDVVLLSKLNPRMKRVWWPRPSGVGTPVCSPEFLALVPRSGIPTSYLYAVASFDEHFYAELLSHVTGTTGSRQRVKPQDALGCAVAVPSPGELRA